MKIERESIFMSSLRAFFVAFFAICGVLVGLTLLSIGIASLVSLSKTDDYPSSMTFLPDAQGSRKELGSDVPVILQLDIDGQIGRGQLTGKKIESLLLKTREDKFKEGRVKAILLSINSPGGGVIDSDAIYRHLRDYKHRFGIPIYAYVDGLCASGGYYISMAADRIYASDVSLIGSIGVKSWPPYVNVSDALEKMGISSETLSAGKGKDEMNPFRPWREGEQANYQKLIDYYYWQFVQLVTAHRPAIDEENLVQIYGAEVFPAPYAAHNGLIDHSGAERRQVLTDLVSAAGIEGDYQVVGVEAESWWLKALKETLTFSLRDAFHPPSAALFEYK